MPAIKRTAVTYTLQVFASNEPENSPYLTGDKLYKLINKYFSLDVVNLNDTDNITIEVNKRAKNFLFASIGKNTDMRKDPFARSRPDPQAHSKPITDDLKIEFFTYFLIHYPTSSLIVLNAQKAPNVPLEIKRHLNSGIHVDVTEARVVASIINVRNKLLGWSKLTEFFIATTDTSAVDENTTARKLSKAFRNGHIKGYKIKVQYVPTDINEDVIKAIEDIDLSEYEDDIYEIKGIAHNGKSDKFNLTKHFLQSPVIIEHQETRESLESGIEKALLNLISTNN